MQGFLPHLARDPARPKAWTSLHLRQVRGHRHQAEYRDPRDPSDHECGDVADKHTGVKGSQAPQGRLSPLATVGLASMLRLQVV